MAPVLLVSNTVYKVCKYSQVVELGVDRQMYAILKYKFPAAVVADQDTAKVAAQVATLNEYLTCLALVA
jgi:hypothetical protein